MNKPDQVVLGAAIGRRASKLIKGLMIIDVAIALDKLNVDLDLERLLAFKDGDFLHDVVGIFNHADWETGELKDCFLPRCAK